MARRDVVWLMIVATIGVMFYGLTPMIAGQDSIYRTYGPLIEVDALIRREYVHAVSPDTMVDGAIDGVMQRLDPYSGYVPPGEMEAFVRRNTGRYVGVGLEVGGVDGVITVISPSDGSPAARAGVRPGDVLLSVDGHPTDGLSVFEIECLLSGEPGTSVALRLQRQGRISEFNLVRAEMHEQAVRGWALDAMGQWDYTIDAPAAIAYVRVSKFNTGMIDEFDAVLATAALRGAAGLIVDLRFNPGGVMSEAVALADRFLDSGVIVERVNRWRAVKTYTATPESTFRPVELAILVNGSSASSSEIVAGALQDHGRAVIVGERTFGKGSVQDFIPLQGGQAGVRLTVAYYRLPSGRMIHRTADNAASGDWGVIPDVVIPLSPEERAAILDSRRVVDGSMLGIDQTGSTIPYATGRGERRLIIDRQLAASVKVLNDRLAARRGEE